MTNATEVRQHRGKQLVQLFNSRSCSWTMTFVLQVYKCHHPQGDAFSQSPDVLLHVPYLTEQRGEFMVVHSPGCEHLCVVIVEGSQLRQTAQETGKVLRLLRML